MKLLIITYSYTPELTPRAFRWSAIASKLAQMGHEVHVLTAAIENNDTADSAVTVFRIKDRLLNASSRLTPGTIASCAQKTWGENLRGRIRRIVRKIWRATYWPDFACGWVIPAAYNARNLCETHRYDWVITVSHPFTGHLVGLLLKPQSFNSRWFVDIGDPFYLMQDPKPNNFMLYSWLSRKTESAVLTQAQAISVTTESTRKLYESSFSDLEGRITVIPPVISLPSIPGHVKQNDNEAIKLVYVGTLYKGLRNPRFLIECFSHLLATYPHKPIELHFYGAINDCHEEFMRVPPISQLVFLHGMVSRLEVFQAMQAADVLVNIGNHSESQLASKVIEYMAVGKPILNFVTMEQDTSLSALEGYPAVMTIQKQAGPVSVSKMAMLYNFVVNPPKVPASYAAAIRARYSPEKVAGMYADILDVKTEHV